MPTANPNRTFNETVSPASPPPINVNTLTEETKPYSVPPPPGDPSSNYTSALTSISDIFSAADTPTQLETTQNTTRSTLQRLYDFIGGKGGSVKSDGTVDTTGALFSAQDKNAQARGYANISDAYGQLTSYNKQIQSLQKEALAIPLQLQQDATGRGVTTGGLQPIQAGMLRNNAIRALQLSALAQSVQGDITQAEQSAARAVQIEFLPYQTALNTLQATYTLNKDQLDREDKKRSEKIQALLNERTRLLEIAKDDKKTIVAMASAAAKNFPNDKMAQYAAKKALETNDLATAFSLVGQYQSDPNATAQLLADIEYKRQQTALTKEQILKTRADTAKTNAEAAELSGKAGTTAQVYNERQSAINLVNTILTDPMLDRAVGGGVWNPLTYIPGAGTQVVRNQMTQLTAILALDNRAKLKGSGQISDFESKTLNQAASSFSTNLSDADARKQLKQIRGVLTTMNGGSASVVVKNPSTGETATANANTEAINKMISDGLVVQYD